MARRKRLGAGSTGLEAAGMELSAAAMEAGQRVEVPEPVPMDRIDPDPDNPRGLNLTIEELKAFADASESQRASRWEKWRSDELAAIVDLARSVREMGVKQPIRVYRTGTRVRIIYGENRYWASHLAEKPSIPAFIHDSRPDDVPVLQAIENLHRSQNSAYLRLRSFEQVLRQRFPDLSCVTKAQAAEACHLNETVAWRFLMILQGPADIYNALTDRSITSIAQALAIIKSPRDQQAVLLSAAKQGATAATLSALMDTPASGSPGPTAASRAKGATRPAKSVKLGVAKSPALIQALFTSDRPVREFLPQGFLTEVDLSTIEGCQSAWNAFMEALKHGSD